MVAKNSEEIARIKIACTICKRILVALGKMVEAGMTTYDIEKRGEELIRENRVVSAFRNYNGYPADLCVSVNEEVVHGIPSRKRVLKEGDIVSIDIGVIYKGYCGDCADTFPVGEIKSIHRKLIEVTRRSFEAGVAMVLPEKRIGDIGAAIENFVEENSFSVVKEFAGHGIGKNLHEYPEIPNFGIPGTGAILRENMILAIEPMINQHKAAVRILDDGWTVVTKDGGYSAHYENCVLVGRQGPEILTA